MQFAFERAELLERLRSLASPGLFDAISRVVRPFASLELGASNGGRTWVGGLPAVPDGFEWPREPQFDDRPLAFIAQIDLSAAPREVLRDVGLPEDGLLSFFYDSLNQPWGFDPKDRSGWRLYHLPGDGTLREPPNDVLWWDPSERAEFGFKTGWAAPDAWWKPPRDVSFTEAHLKEWTDVVVHAAPNDEYETYLSDHRLGGWQDLIQGELQEECQLASNGFFVGDGEGYKRGAAIAYGAGDWRLILQLSSMSEPHIEFALSGELYLMMDNASIAARDWGRAWTVVQGT